MSTGFWFYWMFYDHFSAHSLLAKLGRWGWWSNVNRKFDDPPNIRPSAPPNKTGHCTHFKGCLPLYINLTYNFRRNCAILLNHVIACTYYEIIIYVWRNNILHCWYIKVLYVIVVPIMSGDKLAHETISCCHIHIPNDPPQIATEFIPPPQVSDITPK